MYDRSLFLKLNNYGYSDESITEVKDYLMNLRLPEKVDTNAKAKRYNQKWNQFEIREDKLFQLIQSILVFLETQSTLVFLEIQLIQSIQLIQ